MPLLAKFVLAVEVTLPTSVSPCVKSSVLNVVVVPAFNKMLSPPIYENRLAPALPIVRQGVTEDKQLFASLPATGST